MGFLGEFFSALWNDISKICGEKVTLGDNPITTLNIIIWSLYIGFIIGIIITVYNRFVLGSLIRRLIEKGAYSEGGAITVAEARMRQPVREVRSQAERHTQTNRLHGGRHPRGTLSEKRLVRQILHSRREHTPRGSNLRQLRHQPSLDSTVRARVSRRCSDILLCHPEPYPDANQLHLRRDSVKQDTLTKQSLQKEWS